MKRKILLMASLVALIAIVSIGSLAYFTAEDTAQNIITSGNVKIELEEWTKNEDDELVAFDDLDGVMPGTSASKIVQVKNIGIGDAYIRVKIYVSIELADGVDGEVDHDLIVIDFNTVEWTLEDDGYYYYKEPLIAGDKTVPLFTTVTFSETMGNLYQNSKATVDVQAFAVQSANNGDTVFEAEGWPEAKKE